MKFGKYEVDTSRPPIRPPGRIVREGFFSFGETKESKQDHKDYKAYLEAYGKAIGGKR